MQSTAFYLLKKEKPRAKESERAKWNLNKWMNWNWCKNCLKEEKYKKNIQLHQAAQDDFINVDKFVREKNVMYNIY